MRGSQTSKQPLSSELDVIHSNAVWDGTSAIGTSIPSLVLLLVNVLPDTSAHVEWPGTLDLSDIALQSLLLDFQDCPAVVSS